MWSLTKRKIITNVFKRLKIKDLNPKNSMFMDAKIRYNQAKNNISPRNNLAISIKETNPPRRLSDIIFFDFPQLKIQNHC